MLKEQKKIYVRASGRLKVSSGLNFIQEDNLHSEVEVDFWIMQSTGAHLFTS